MSFNTLIYKEQGGGALRFQAGASVSFGDTDLYFGSDLPAFAARSGAIYFRSGGSFANIYVNRTNSASTGIVWKGASLFS